jgi:hypothetical protein
MPGKPAFSGPIWATKWQVGQESTSVRSRVLARRLCGCPSKDDSSGSTRGGDIPPPPPPTVSSAAKATACATPGDVKDAVSAAFFPKTVLAYCIDPQGETKTYGDRAKQLIADVPFDGDIEVYKRFGLKRLVTLRYIDGGGKGGTADVVLSELSDEAAAYGFYTFRVVSGDPADKSAPRVLAAKGRGAIGTGRAYVWRGKYLVELQYNNEQEAESALAKSSEAILTALSKELGEKLPGAEEPPAAALALPRQNLVPNGIVWAQKEPYGVGNLGAGAIGYYADGGKRWRVLSLATTDAEQAKDAMKTLRGRPGALPVPGIGDEAVHLTVSASKDAPKVELYVGRKAGAVFGVSDEEYALMAAGAPDKQAAVRVAKDDALTQLKSLLSGHSGAPPASPAPSSSAAKGAGK